MIFGDFFRKNSVLSCQKLEYKNIQVIFVKKFILKLWFHMFLKFAVGAILQVVAIGKKLLVMQWRHSAAWTAWCPASDTDTVDGFQYVRVSTILFTTFDSFVLYSCICRFEVHPVMTMTITVL
jgi:hypothetical protein